MALINLEDLRIEIGEKEESNDELLRVMADGVLGLFESFTQRTLTQTALTEYYNSSEYCDRIFLRNWPVATSPAVQIWDDPDWVWATSDLVPATDYRVDYTRGIVYYSGGYFFEGKQSIKVCYTAGYATLPAGMKRILVRQGAHWFRQAKDQKWDVASVSLPAGAGTTSYKFLESNMLPDFALLIEKERMKW